MCSSILICQTASPGSPSATRPRWWRTHWTPCGSPSPSLLERSAMETMTGRGKDDLHSRCTNTQIEWRKSIPHEVSMFLVYILNGLRWPLNDCPELRGSFWSRFLLYFNPSTTKGLTSYSKKIRNCTKEKKKREGEKDELYAWFSWVLTGGWSNREADALCECVWMFVRLRAWALTVQKSSKNTSNLALSATLGVNRGSSLHSLLRSPARKS